MYARMERNIAWFTTLGLVWEAFTVGDKTRREASGEVPQRPCPSSCSETIAVMTGNTEP